MHDSTGGNDPETITQDAPSALATIAEIGRAAAEFSALVPAWPLLNDTPTGDGHTVVFIPAFLAGDASTAAARRWLHESGYTPRRWGLGTNTARLELIDQLYTEFLRISDEVAAPVSLVGHSMGGVFARELSRRYPSRVRQVITLGSPFAMDDLHSASPAVRLLFERISRSSIADLKTALATSDPKTPPPVRSTAIYSRADGIVDWRACLERPSALTENIEVYGSHSGMPVNPVVLHVIADRLSQNPGGWQPFDRSRGVRRYLLPQD